MDEQKQPQQKAEAEPKRTDVAVEDLEPEEEDAEAVKGGIGSYSNGASDPGD